MGRRKSDAGLILFLLIIGLPILLFQKTEEAIGIEATFGIILAVIAIFIFYKIIKENARATAQKKVEEERIIRFNERKAQLLKKYKDAEVVERILNRRIWQGESREQLRESLGEPFDIDSKVMKKKKREIWKYNHQGANRYGLRITLENGVIVGWDQKD